MFRKSIVFILAAVATVTAYGQTPEAKKEKEKAAQVLAWSFEDDGGYLGIQMREVNRDNFAKFNLREVRGVAIEKVQENSPASAAGLLAGDVIVSVNGEEVTSSRKLSRLIGEIAPDHQVKLVVSRNGGDQEITATIGQRPMSKWEKGDFAFTVPGQPGKIDLPDLKEFKEFKGLPQMKELPQGELPQIWTSPEGDSRAFAWRSGSGRQIGIGITPLTKQLADHFGVDGGILVNDVREGSPAFKVGIKAGDIIVDADGKPVKSDLDLIRIINGKKEGDVQLTFVRDRNRQTIKVTPEATKTPGFIFEMPDRPAVPPAAMTLLRPGRIL